MQTLDLPELQIMAILVVSTKLLFPFDGISRHPATAKEPGTQAMDWDLWARAQRQFNSHTHANGSIGKEMLIQLSDKDVLGMGSNQLDEYMDWYEKSWQDMSRPATTIAELFPTSRTGMEQNPEAPSTTEPQDTPDKEDESVNKILQTVIESLTPVAVRPKGEAACARPGSWYRRYRWESSLTDSSRLFFEIAAQLAGVSFSTLIRAVTVVEWRLADWQERRRRPDQRAYIPDDIANGDYGATNDEYDQNQPNEIVEEIPGDVEEQLLELESR